MKPSTRPAAAPAIALPPWSGPVLLTLAFAALLLSVRGAPLGTAVADDYSFLARLRFQHPIDPFDTMGATYYWRPLSRQVYFSLLGPTLLSAPWIAATVNALVILALAVVIYRTARRALPPPLAALVASFPLLSEPARVLIGWPSGAQHALASLGAALAIHEAVAGRAITAAAAALGGMLCHESAAMTLPLIPAIAWLRTRRPSDAIRAAIPAAAAGIAWGIGYAIARGHGVTLPPSTGAPYPIALVPGLIARALRAALSLEDVRGATDDLLIFGAVVIVLAGIAIAFTARARTRLRPLVPAILAGTAWFLVGTLPLAYILPDWNAWRDWNPALALGVSLTLFLALVSPWLAAGFATIKLLGLLLSPAAPPVVAPGPPDTGSHMSFVRLVRLQRIVDSTRRVLASHHPTLGKGAAVIYWFMPQLAEVGFQRNVAPRVWYADSTLVWDKFGGMAGFDKHMDAMVQFINNVPAPATIIELEAMKLFQAGGREIIAENYRAADSLLARIEHVQPVIQGPFYISILDNRAIVAFNQMDYGRADSLNRVAIAAGADANTWAMAANLALLRNQRDEAIKAVQKCLLLEPTNGEGNRLAQALGMRLQ